MRRITPVIFNQSSFAFPEGSDLSIEHCGPIGQGNGCGWGATATIALQSWDNLSWADISGIPTSGSVSWYIYQKLTGAVKAPELSD